MADALKAGVRLKPELFQDASVYFSDISGFVDLLSELSPLEIVSLLGQLWITFDDIIARHKVYKVIGISAANVFVCCCAAYEEILTCLRYKHLVSHVATTKLYS
jgi:atrial natriuretic peptide receptor B